MDVGNPSNMKRIIDIYNNIQGLENDLCSWSFSDNQTKEQIIETFNSCKYLLDPHSAIGLLGLKKYLNNNYNCQGIFLGTAHPAKFSDIIEPIIKEKINMPDRLKKMMDKDKKSVKIKNNFKEFSDYLLSKFK